MAPILVVQLTLAESWLHWTDTETLVGVQGTGERGNVCVQVQSINEII